LKLRSFNPPMSVLRPTLKVPLDEVVEVAWTVVVDAFFDEPHPAAAAASTTTRTANGMSLFTAPPEF
jgi:hypothetical protein